MGNQQELSNVCKTDLAWLAGMFNGDGCFSLTFAIRANNNVKCDLSLTLTQCDPSIIEEATRIMNMLEVNPGISQYQPGKEGNRIKYNLRITKMAHIAKVIDAICCYMIGDKLAQAKLMRRYIERRIKYADSTKRQNGASIIHDNESVNIAKQFYALRESIGHSGIPKHVADVLNDYPAREYGQVAGSARH